jgi:putative transposase
MTSHAGVRWTCSGVAEELWVEARVSADGRVVLCGARYGEPDASRTAEGSALDELAREGARQMIAAALKLEVEEYVARLKEHRDERGRALVVRNGSAKPRRVTVGSGTVELEAPRVNDKRVIDGERQQFVSAILPPYLRRSKNVSELLPLLYLRGLSTGDFREALPVLLARKPRDCRRARLPA